jgi:penicillin-binding protein 2
MTYGALPDKIQESRLVSLRLVVIFLFVLILISILVVRYYFLQIVHYETYHTKSDSNRVFLQRIPPSRGLITDRQGRLVAENQPAFLLAIVPDKVSDLDSLIEELGALGLASDEDVDAFYKRKERQRSFEQVPLRFDLSDEEIAKVVANRPRLKGVEIKADLLRFYPYGDLMAHMLGYVGRINDREQRKLDQKNYSGTNHIGKIGVEKYYEDVLHGKVGFENVETNAAGRVLRVLKRVNPQKGQDIQLHLDVDLQKVAVKALGEKRGAIVVLDATNGGVLAAVSTPSYDPNEFVNGISFKDYDELKEDPDIPLFNRVLQAQYPPGSVIKPVMALAGLEKGIVTPKSTINDPGWYQLPNDDRLFRDWKRTGHGKAVNLRSSMEQSCDVYYYDLAVKLGVRDIHHYFDLFGIGKKTGIDVPSERKGINPSPQWKRSQGRSSWFTGDSLNMSIGQGFLLTTPIQLAVMTNIIANDGLHYAPRIVHSIEGKPLQPEMLAPVELHDPAHWDVVKRSMMAVVHGRRGTARKIAKGMKYKMAGKTGTAQVVGIAQGEKYDAEALKERQRDHALFVGFAPFENPQISVAVMVENGGSGSGMAAPMARKVMDAWILREQSAKKSFVGGDNAAKQ